MRTEAAKGDVELDVFREFARRGPLVIDPGSCEKSLPPAPDVLCVVQGEGRVAFELVELCDPSLAQLISRGAEAEGVYLRTSDPSLAVLSKKLRKRYQSPFPVELLCFSGRAVSPDSTVIATLRPLLRSRTFQYRRVWFLGRKAVHQLWPVG